jgi:hypothetical protein
MVPENSYPDEDTEYDNFVFHLLPNTTIEYKLQYMVNVLFII